MAVIVLRDFVFLVPEIFLASAGMLLLVAGAVGQGVRHRTASAVTLASLLVTAILVIWVRGAAGDEARVLLAGSIILDGFAFVWKLILLLATALTVLLASPFVEEGRYRAGEFYSLLLLAATGMLLMVSGDSLLSIWIALELMALSSYILAGYFKRETKSNEAALKYFILGALSSAVMLYGISLLYGATGTIRLPELATALAGPAGAGGLAALGWLFLLAGLLFKVAAVPFHVWTPDVYVGAPTPVTAFLAVASKAASFAILVRVLYRGLPGLAVDWQMVLAVVSAITMIWGNLAALTQTNVKRMLAYSSIAHAGYILLGVLAANEIGLQAVLFYLLAYSFMTLGAFATVVLLERREYAGELYEDYAGLAGRAPFLAAMMLLFMLALTGIPPTGGFVGKFFLFAAAIQAGWTWLAVVGALTSAVSLFYYLGIGVQMYLKDADRAPAELMPSPVVRATIAFCAVATVLLGVLPGPFLDWVRTGLLALP